MGVAEWPFGEMAHAQCDAPVFLPLNPFSGRSLQI